MKLTSIVGSVLYGYDDPKSDVDVKGVFTLPLEQRLSPLGFQSTRTEKEYAFGVPPTPNIKYEIRMLEFSEFLKKLWQADLNTWETLYSTRVLEEDSEMQHFRYNVSETFCRPNLLRERAFKMATYHHMKALEDNDGKKAVHALKSLWLTIGVLTKGFDYTQRMDGDILWSIRHVFDSFKVTFETDYEILTKALEDIKLPKDQTQLNEKHLEYVRSVYVKES